MRTPLIRRPSDAPAQMLFRGMSFIEVMISVLISSIIVAGLQGTIFLALNSMPDSTGVASTALRVSQTADRLAAELQTAVFITERSATVIGFVVPDRDGD
ncbi:MAG: prepilin-type N-terminal cleavage/methylation domain-containing protein, partial [Fuerstia sp.]|nr:prepilin-type N-terminal cleavage/methylation domain-containing protein [Fuerstiella sp.]